MEWGWNKVDRVLGVAVIGGGEKLIFGSFSL